MAPIQRGLEDRHPYVRRTAVMGVLKVHNFDAAAVQNAGEFGSAAPKGFKSAVARSIEGVHVKKSCINEVMQTSSRC